MGRLTPKKKHNTPLGTSRRRTMKKVLLIAALLALFFPSVLSATNPKETAKTLKAEVIADEAEIFLEASRQSIVIDTVPKGTTMTLFKSGQKNKKWLYISYLSKKRGSKVTGFVDRNKVEIIKEHPPDEPENPEDSAEQLSEENNSDLEKMETQEAEKESEELRNLLKEMEREKQERQTQQEITQEVEKETREEVVKQEQAEKEQEIRNEVTETQKEENLEIASAAEQETTELQEKVKEEKKEEQQAQEQEETRADEEAETEETQQDTAKQEIADEQEVIAQEQQEMQEEAPADEEAITEKTQETVEEELPKVLTKVSVKVPRANIRLMPTTQSSIIHQARSGVELIHIAKTGNWHRVNLAPNNEGIVLSGYIHKNIVDEIYETVAPPPEPKKIPEKEPEVIEEEAKPEPESVQEIPTLQTSSQGKYYWVGGGAGYTMPSESHFGKGINFSGTLGFGVTKHLAMELRVPYFQRDVIGTADGLSSGRLSSLSLMLSVQGRYPIKNRIVPYLVAGGDYHLNTFSLNEEIVNSWNNLGFNIHESVDHTFGFHFGAGLDFFLIENIVLNMDVRYYTANLTGERTLANQNGQETSGKIGNMQLNSLQAGISLKLFLNPLTRKK
jgi:outer membrane protein W